MASRSVQAKTPSVSAFHVAVQARARNSGTRAGSKKNESAPKASVAPTVSGDSSRDSASVANAAATMRYEVALWIAENLIAAASRFDHPLERGARAAAAHHEDGLGGAIDDGGEGHLGRGRG